MFLQHSNEIKSNANGDFRSFSSEKLQKSQVSWSFSKTSQIQNGMKITSAYSKTTKRPLYYLNCFFYTAMTSTGGASDVSSKKKSQNFLEFLKHVSNSVRIWSWFNEFNFRILTDYKEVSLVFQLFLLHSKEIKLRGQWRFQMFLLRKRLQKSHLFSVSQKHSQMLSEFCHKMNLISAYSKSTVLFNIATVSSTQQWD